MDRKEQITEMLKEKCYKQFANKNIFRLDNVSRETCF